MASSGNWGRCCRYRATTRQWIAVKAPTNPRARCQISLAAEFALGAPKGRPHMKTAGEIAYHVWNCPIQQILRSDIAAKPLTPAHSRADTASAGHGALPAHPELCTAAAPR